MGDAKCCGVGNPEKYKVSSNIYGLISGPDALTDGHLYPTDKARAWLSNNKVLENWANGACCNVGTLEKCLCNVAKIAEIGTPTGVYRLVVVEDPAKVSPQWT